MKVLITGAAGYLGGELVRALGEDHELTLCDLRRPDDAADDPRWVTGDVTELNGLRSIVAGNEAVVHTVALVRGRWEQPLDRFVDVMVKGTWNIAQACAEEGVSRLVNISSIAAPGIPPSSDRMVRNDESVPLGQADLFYGLSKRLGEQIVNTYGESYPELATVNIRPGVIAGDGANPGPARDSATAPHWFIYVDVRDVAQAVRGSLATTPAPRGSYAIVAGRDDALYDWRDAAEKIGYVSEYTWPEL